MKIKNKLLIAATVILSLCSVTVFALMTYAYLNPENYKVGVLTIFEKEAYALSGLCYLLIYHQIIRKSNKSLKSKMLTGIAISAVCTVQVILLNTMWHYISFNEMFDWVYPARYLGFVLQDLSYTGNGNWFKYPMVFLLTFLACLFDAFLLRPLINLYVDAFFGGYRSSEEGYKNDNQE